MSKPPRRPPAALLQACRRHRVRPTRDILVVSVAAQRMVWFQRGPCGNPFAAGGYRARRVFLASTSKFGFG